MKLEQLGAVSNTAWGQACLEMTPTQKGTERSEEKEILTSGGQLDMTIPNEMLTDSSIMGPNKFLFVHKPVGLRNVMERVSTKSNWKYLPAIYCFHLITFIRVDTLVHGAYPYT